MIVKVQSRDGEVTLEFDPDLEAHHPETVVLNGEPKGRNFRKKHLEILGYLMTRKNEEVSYSEIAKEVWETTVGGPYGTIYKTTQQVATLIGNNWIKHKPNVSIEFCTLIRAEHPESAYMLLKESESVPVEVSGKRIASLWVPPFRRPLSQDGTNNEITLLLAKTAITDLVGRDDLWRDCLAWCEDSSLGPVSVFCIQGRGGCGKTRFALEFVHYLRSLKDWDARFVQFERSEPFDLWARTAGLNHVLLVCDYASDHAAAIADSLRLLKDSPPRDGTRRLRILLLARSASFRSGWLLPFESTGALEYGQSPRDYFRPNDPIAELTPLSIEDKIRVFKQTYHAAAKYLGLGEQILDESDFLDDQVGGVHMDPLSLMLVALAGLRNGIPGALLLTKSELAREVAKLFVEQRLRAAFPENAALGLHMTAYATISSGLTLDAARETLVKESQALHLGSIADPTAFLDRLAAWLPNKEGNQLGAVEPDILGEAFVLDQLSPRGEVGKEIILRAVQARPPQVIQFLIRTAQDFSLAQREPRTEPLEWLEALIERGDADDHSLLRSINNALPELTVVLRPYAVSIRDKISSRIIQMMMTAEAKGKLTKDLVLDLPVFLHDLSIAQGKMGLFGDSLHNAEKAASIFRGLAEADRDAFIQLYASSLCTLAQAQQSTGQHEAALFSAHEAVVLARELFERDRDAFLIDLTSSLECLSAIESEEGSNEAAIASAMEAVSLFRGTSESKLNTKIREYALSLVNLGVEQRRGGQFNSGLASAEEAVNLLDHFVERNRYAFLDQLAGALNALATIQCDVGKHVAAIDNEMKAVDVLHELEGRNRDAFLPSLAGYLRNLSDMQNKAGQHGIAIATALQAVTLFRELTGYNRRAFLREFALSLRVLGDLQSEAGQYDAALASGREEVSSFRELTEDARDAFLSDLARSVSLLTFRLKKADQSEDAFATAQEAVSIYRELVERDRDIYLPKLSACLNILARFQGEAGHFELATICTSEAVTIYLELLGRDFDSFINLYVTSCESLGKFLISSRRPTEAMRAFSECLKQVLFRIASANGQSSDALIQRALDLIDHYLDSAEMANTDPDTGVVLFAASILGPHLEQSKEFE